MTEAGSMVEESDRERSPKLPASFAPVLYDGVGSEFVGVGLVRNLDVAGNGNGAGPSVWRREHAFVEDAREFHEWMVTRPERWTVWARIAPIVGPDMLALVMESERDRDLRGMAELKEQAAAIARTARTVTAASTRILGRSCVTLRRGDEDDPFLVIAFVHTVERDRLWDWVRWQTHRYREWRALWEQEGYAALRNLIMGSMIIEERRVKASGLASGGQRPLRLWRGGRDNDTGDPGVTD
jgi:hypothetical protein